MTQLPFRVMLELSKRTKDSVISEFCVGHLKEQGYGITEPDAKYETPGNFLKRLGLWPTYPLSEAIKRYEARGNYVPVTRGPTGRLREILSNEGFDKFCRRKMK